MDSHEQLIVISAHAHSLCLSILMCFHLCLIAGKPWGHLTMAGKYPGVLPPKMRLFSAVSFLILAAVLLTVEIAIGSFLHAWQETAQRALIAIVIFNSIQTFLHIITPSKWERILWLPLITVMLLSSIAVWRFI